ncbi:MAG: tetratricopeptide repeat protein [Candidatus Neomarinimicrobiota bacterium]
MELIFILIILILIGSGIFYFSLRPKIQQRTESLYTNALNAMVRGDSRTALKHLRDVVKQDTEHVDAYLQMGDIFREQGNSQQALKIHQSLTVRPNLSDALKKDIHKSLALDFLQNEQLNKARREAEYVLKLEKRNEWANNILLEIAESQGDWERAVQTAKIIQKIKQVQDAPQLSRFKVFQGLDILKKGHRKEAEQHFNKAIKLAPDYGMPYLHLANLKAEERDLVKAIENWEKFALNTPLDGHKVFSKIEAALFDLGRFSEVENFYKRILEKDAGNLDALANLANVLEEKGEHNNALKLVDEALAQFDDSIHARLMKLKLSLNVSKPHELSQQIDKMIELVTSEKAEK